ncbi:MMPL family transporter [Actinoplanes flavus]|uniref:MMPL family transporter n=1 Tax=Actinoplanes flavus TaxID=2820290 RepID=A0ABS3UFU0_9ACTN|nr:MMPL family transporter [Actinoplanes flavus]MBO3736562.1 MMPL family transporter [Actinoplanes flavus]
MHRIIWILTGRVTAWLAIAAALAVTGVLTGLGGTAQQSDVVQALPPNAESTHAADLQKRLPSGRLNPALVIYARDDAALTESDKNKFKNDAIEYAQSALAGRVSPPVFADNGQAALVAVPLDAAMPVEDLQNTVEKLRAVAGHELPDGLTAQVTGGAGFTADIAASFSGADTTLLLATVAVVTALLLITYRSPWLWIVPLAVVGAADGATNATLALLSRTANLPLDSTTTGIVDVLVFGAGTDYALLLIARYREELRQNEDRRAALRNAVHTAGPAIAASALTVCLGLLALLAAPLTFTRTIGIAGALGVAIAAVFALTALPAALAVCGRRLFWPFTPKPGQPNSTTTGVWARLGTLVSRHPRRILAFSLALLAVLTAGLADASIGLSRTEQFRVQAQSLDGFATLQRHFPAGAADPTIIITRQSTQQQVLAAIVGTPGVVSAHPTEQADGLTAIDVVLRDAPDTTGSYDTIRALRAAVHAIPSAEAAVGGTVAANLDKRTASTDALSTVVPLVLAVVLLVLILLLRSLVAPIVLMLTVVATYFAALGAATFLFVHVLGYPGLDNEVPLLSFIFLVALGIDYNIFLATRAREEAHALGTRDGMRTALAATGGVITSAGILLAAVFAVLGVLPLVTLTELGIIVGIGVLLDTLLVRTLLVPAIAMLLGDTFWYPGKPHRAAPANRHFRQPSIR